MAAGGAAGGAGDSAGAQGGSAASTGSWKRITSEHSAKDDAKATNPNYDEDSIEWSENCQRCVPTYELRRRGYDVTVKPRPTEIRRGIFFGERKIAKRDDHLSHSPFDVWIPPESVHISDGQLGIENQMAEWGNGARAEIMVLWEGQGGKGHVFVAEQINGVTHFIDPQTGVDGVGWYFDECDLSKIYICRTDDKAISEEYIKDCCE